jgi:virginiamycin B lyase
MLAAFFGLSSSPTQAQPGQPSAGDPALRRPEEVTSFSVPHPLMGLTAGPDGNLWAPAYCYFCNDMPIARISLQGAVTEYPLILNPYPALNVPIVTGADGNLWLVMNTTQGATLVRYVIATQTATIFPITQPSSLAVSDIAAGPDGNLWLANADTILRCTTAGACTGFPLTRQNFNAARITAGPDGNIWFTEANYPSRAGAIGRITPAGEITDFDVPCCPAPLAITSGPDGNLWFTEIGAVGRITPAGVTTLFPDSHSQQRAGQNITAGLDGNIWLNYPDGQFSRITPAGVLDTFSQGGNGEIVTAPDGTLWMSNSAELGINTGILVRVSLNDGSPLPTGVPTIVATVEPPPTPVPTALPTVIPPLCAVTWADVAVNSGFYVPVTTLACRGIVGGYPCGGVNPQTGQPEPCTGGADAPASSPPYYRPGNWVSRGQAAKIIALSAGLGGRVSRQTFADVPPTSPFFIAVEALVAHGLANGYRCGASGEPCDDQNRPYYRPSTNITRGQLAKLIGGAAGYSTVPPGQLFADVPATNGFYGWVQQVGSRGIIGGYACGGVGEPCDAQNRPYYRPNGAATRAQTAKIDVGVFP